MKLAVAAAVTLTSIMAVNSAMAQTKSEKCAAYAREANVFEVHFAADENGRRQWSFTGRRSSKNHTKNHEVTG